MFNLIIILILFLPNIVILENDEDFTVCSNDEDKNSKLSKRFQVNNKAIACKDCYGESTCTKAFPNDIQNKLEKGAFLEDYIVDYVDENEEENSNANCDKMRIIMGDGVTIKGGATTGPKIKNGKTVQTTIATTTSPVIIINNTDGTTSTFSQVKKAKINNIVNVEYVSFNSGFNLTLCKDITKSKNTCDDQVLELIYDFGKKEFRSSSPLGFQLNPETKAEGVQSQAQKLTKISFVLKENKIEVYFRTKEDDSVLGKLEFTGKNNDYEITVVKTDREQIFEHLHVEKTGSPYSCKIKQQFKSQDKIKLNFEVTKMHELLYGIILLKDKEEEFKMDALKDLTRVPKSFQDKISFIFLFNIPEEATYDEYTGFVHFISYYKPNEYFVNSTAIYLDKIENNNNYFTITLTFKTSGLNANIYHKDAKDENRKYEISRLVKYGKSIVINELKTINRIYILGSKEDLLVLNVNPCDK